MKVAKIEVSDFRGFPGPAKYDFEFGSARNLFIYGENGSGKSSLFRAVQEMFNRRKGAKAFAEFKNNQDPTLTIGHVTVSFDDGSSQTWAYGGNRPLNNPPASQMALQVGCLDYRSLLETNFAQRRDYVDIFHIAVRHLVPHLEVPVDGKSQRIGELWSSVSRPINHRGSRVAVTNVYTARFNAAFEPVIKPLVDKASELLAKFPGCDFTLGAAFKPIVYDTIRRNFQNEELFLSVHRKGQHLPDHHNFLNEARLSAIGLVIYLAGLLTSVPGVSQYPKLLVLDDVLVGLDMGNRRPVLEILAQEFSDWQVILLTHDKVWYEMVQVDMESKPDWGAYEIWLADDGITPIHRPRSGGPAFFLDRADEHLAANDDRAAAVYARAAFEVKVKKYCDKKSVPVPYKKEARRMDAESFWKAATANVIDNAPNAAEKTAAELMFAPIQTAKKVILNPLSHSAPQPVTKQEIREAILAVRNLTFPSK
jgi:energy-coupling factor transporter ATP-binding protein EcfA2